MVVVPEYTELATTIPVGAVTVAIRASLLLQEPPVVLLLNVIVLPWHIGPEPVIGEEAPMFTVVLVRQPDVSVYVMSALPLLTPVNNPVVDPIVAILVLLLCHVPPADASDNDTKVLAGILVVPLIAFTLFTVTIVVIPQPAALV